MSNLRINEKEKPSTKLPFLEIRKKNPTGMLKFYQEHLDISIDWLLRSIRTAKGSSAHFSFLGWSQPYPETTGYLIPTLINYAAKKENADFLIRTAESLGSWLLSIQSKNGFWNAGVHKNGMSEIPSIFNTAQILKGMASLYLETGDSKWVEAGYNGAKWLSDNLNTDGIWRIGNYRDDFNPSYYTQVAWPMLEIWNLTNDQKIKNAAVMVLDRILTLRLGNGAFNGWSFDNDKPAFTHTIAYTLRGFQESARILSQYDKYEKPVRKILDYFIRSAELNNGRIPGAFYFDLKPENKYSCLTGNVQLAICFLNYYQQTNDLRIVNSSAKAIDFVCSQQAMRHLISPLKGAVAGSYPLRGKYMRFRYPNWAVKYLADSLMKIMSVLKKEGLS